MVVLKVIGAFICCSIIGTLFSNLLRLLSVNRLSNPFGIIIIYSIFVAVIIFAFSFPIYVIIPACLAAYVNMVFEIKGLRKAGTNSRNIEQIAELKSLLGDKYNMIRENAILLNNINQEYVIIYNRFTHRRFFINDNYQDLLIVLKRLIKQIMQFWNSMNDPVINSITNLDYMEYIGTMGYYAENREKGIVLLTKTINGINQLRGNDSRLDSGNSDNWDDYFLGIINPELNPENIDNYTMDQYFQDLKELHEIENHSKTLGSDLQRMFNKFR